MNFELSSHSLRMAIPRGPAAEVLSYGLEQYGNVTLDVLPTCDVIEAWNSGQYSCALIPPLSYFQQAEGSIVPGLGVVASPAANTEWLYHQGPLESLRRVAVHEDASGAAGLAALLIEHTAHARPEFVPAADASAPCDGVLISGLASMLGEAPYEQRWNLQHGLEKDEPPPLPLLLWAVSPRAPYQELRRRLGRACQLGMGAIPTIGAHYDAERGLASGTTQRYLNEHVHYSIASWETQVLREILQMAQHHKAAPPDAAVRFC